MSAATLALIQLIAQAVIAGAPTVAKAAAKIYADLQAGRDPKPEDVDALALTAGKDLRDYEVAAAAGV